MTDCALLMMVYLTGERRIVSSRELEREISFPQQSIFSAGRKLKNAGFLHTIAGPFGGYELAKAPKEITLQDILLGFQDAFCVHDEKYQECASVALRKYANTLADVESEIKNKMSTITLADMLEKTT